MKKNVFLMLVLAVVSSLMFVGCPEKPKDEPKVVAEQYRGTFETEHTTTGFLKIILTKNTCQLISYNSDGNINNQGTPNIAYTEGNILFIDWGKNIGVEEQFTFTDNNSFSYYLYDEKYYSFSRV